MLTIDEIKAKVAPICKEYGIKRAYLFGSYARGDATEDSDVDIRIEPSETSYTLKRDDPNCPFPKNAFMFGGLFSDLEDAFPNGVDMLTKMPDDRWSSIFKENISRDEVLIYEDSRA